MTTVSTDNSQKPLDSGIQELAGKRGVQFKIRTLTKEKEWSWALSTVDMDALAAQTSKNTRVRTRASNQGTKILRAWCKRAKAKGTSLHIHNAYSFPVLHTEHDYSKEKKIFV